MPVRLIETEADLAEGAEHLARVCPVWARVLPDLGPLPLRRRADGFEAIASAIVGQQISTQAAQAIWDRMAAAGLTGQQRLAAAGEEELRAAGLSRAKMRYLRGIAACGLDWDGLRVLPDDQAIAALVALPGIGAWTAEIYLKFALGRADVLAAGDLALQEAARLMYGLEARPGPAALRAMAEPWRPWRAVAARGLWAYYRRAKGREGVR
ncbi:DNA-3-methyladenine glycosylase family protein [Paracoccus siganidrum]|uniref:DNA-3-methyladenine glycosylase II n=1 Tax=Paracoccus siganidrum TaxID=1276757 RepID=A0A419A5L3_9RHOB|nr:DNA-3-methyladenine glycosylase [Paracoccus siganidrum]RJL11688.1 DNA-3-methyladenine glycosylase 2 family protein [Paracoccus siganidrum]RMC41172.1 DNA-3-methyladenine glycosylase 2 family protein [Paracoccus siganidrum]